VSQIPKGKRPHRRQPPEALTRPEVTRAEPAPIDNERCRALIVGAMSMGATLRDAASVCVSAGYDVRVSMISERKAQDEKFREEIDTGVARNITLLEMALNNIALNGKEEGARVRALEFCLKNRAPQKWRDRKELEVTVGDIPGKLREAAERARERKLRWMTGALTAELVKEGLAPSGSEIVPFVAKGGNGNGGNGR
jgi:hypothetical protein